MNDITKTNAPNASRFVESTNARLDIRRDETIIDPRKRKRGDDHPLVETDETATVSVMALYTFLGVLLASRLHPENPPPALPDPPEHKPVTVQQKQAFSAYHKAAPAPPPRIDAIVTAAPELMANSDITLGEDVSDADINRIKGYRDDLMELHRRNVTEITLNRADSFINAIGDAIAAGKQP